jgi:hypothetical protein
MATYVLSKVPQPFVNFTRFGVAKDFNGSSFPDTPEAIGFPKGSGRHSP